MVKKELFLDQALQINLDVWGLYLGCPVGLGHSARGGDGVCEDSPIVRNPGPTDALRRLKFNCF